MVAADHPIADAGVAPELAALADLSMIGFRHCISGERTDEYLRSQGVDLQVVFRSDDNGTVQGLVGAGMAAALVPLLAADLGDERVAVLPMGASVPERQIAIAWHRDRALSPASRAFIDVTRRLCAELQPAVAAAAPAG